MRRTLCFFARMPRQKTNGSVAKYSHTAVFFLIFSRKQLILSRFLGFRALAAAFYRLRLVCREMTNTGKYHSSKYSSTFFGSTASTA